jgi:hypothetical protein
MINAASSGLIISLSNIIRSVVIQIDLHFDKNFAIAFCGTKDLHEAGEEELTLITKIVDR